ncbi:MAG: methyl-accepting chemotaxis protein [Syntrophobacteraceae bacterium]
MWKLRIGIRWKITAGFLMVGFLGLVCGIAGYVSLDRVIEAVYLNNSARAVQNKILESRILEKNYIISGSEESHGKLTQSLDGMVPLTVSLKTLLGQKKNTYEIDAAQEAYKNTASLLKQLNDQDAAALADLQRAAENIESIAKEESAKAVAGVKESILQGNAKLLKNYSRDRIKDIVSIGYDVLKYYHDSSAPVETALEALRNLHFEGSNYYFVVREDITVAAHGYDRSQEGMDFGKIQDKNTGKTFMKEVVENAVKNGESSIEYSWTKPGMGDAVFPKVTYAKYFKPWGLIICAGAYTEDIEQQVGEAGTLLEERLNAMQQANAIIGFADKARLNALYYFAFERNAEKVDQNLSQLKGLPVVTEALKKEADTYRDRFNQRVKNNETRQKEIAGIDEIASKILKDSGSISLEAQDTLAQNTSSGKMLIVLFTLAGAVVGSLLSFFMPGAITKPVNRITKGLEEASDQVASGSGQVASASLQLAEGASEQAAAIEQTSSSLEEMSSMTKRNADNAGQANHLMAETKRIVAQANESMGRMTASMRDISAASEETQKIIKTIDEISFQTNLLALNAAVEAARAGEAGAGFAVVADEVRNLAMRAAEAAKITANLLEGTVKKVKDGSELVEKTSDEFSQVAISASKMDELVSEIAGASQEQAQGIEQVGKAVSEMDKITQQNATTAEESAAASEEMSAQAVQMKDYTAELVALITGKMGNRESHGRSSAPDEDLDPQRVGLAAESRKSLSVPMRGNGNGKAATSHRVVPKEVKPERLIPFDEEELKDF